MSAANKDTPTLVLSGAVVLMAALGGYLWYQVPLQSSRPANPGSERHEAVKAQRALARLWQDPLAAVDEHIKTAKSGAIGRGWNDLADEVTARLTTPAQIPPQISVLLVMTDGSLYVEGTEQRIRDRNAVGSGLSVACYVPEDGDHVGYVLWNRSDPPSSIPYEWYRPRKLRDCNKGGASTSVYDSVLVVWLSDELFGDRPLHDLMTIVNELQRRIENLDLGASAKAVSHNLTYSMIGPSGSSGFRSMVAEAKTDRAGLSWPKHGPNESSGTMRLYSPSATVSSEVVYLGIQGARATAEGTSDEWISTSLHQAGVELAYRIPSDFELAQTLLQELHLRGVRSGQPVALLAEWDSFYGRNLPFEFIVAACLDPWFVAGDRACTGHLQGLQRMANPHEQQTAVPWIHQYSYLRGLDGELPGVEGANRSAGAKKPKALGFGGTDSQRTVAELERPEGEAQLDYVRRLADRLEAAAEGRPFGAIGILGSDVYDKLLILQALRGRFPHTIFFTTDLDVRLLHPSQYDWTHNLIIASHFDVQLHQDLQQEIPPFRNSYQTATFFSVLQAVNHVQRSCPTCPYSLTSMGTQKFSSTMAPHVFEIGRTQAVPLLLKQDQTEAAINRPGTGYHSPARGRQLPFVRFALIPAALFFAFCLAVPVLRSIPQEILSFETASFIIRIAIALALTAGIALIAFHWIGRQPNAEPFFWAEGVSIWPTQLIRLLAIGLCVGFLQLAHHMLQVNASELAAQYALPLTLPQPSASSSSAWITWFLPRSWTVAFRGAAQDLQQLWSEHQQFTASHWRRIVPQTVVLGALGVVLLIIFGIPHTPSRGSWAWWINLFMWSASSILLGLLILFVVDAIRICTGFIHQFAGERTHWPAHVLKPLCEQRKLSPDLVGEWLDIRFIAERTKVVESLIHYPLIALFLTIAARHRIFDDWAYPVGLILLYAISATYIITCAILLSVAAEKARGSAVKRLRDQLYIARANAQEPGQGERWTHHIAQVELLLREIEGVQQGAFAHWTQQPVFQALLLPSGGFSLLALLDYFLTQ